MTGTVSGRIAAVLREHIEHTAAGAFVADTGALHTDLVTVVDELVAEAVADAIREQTTS